MNEKYIYLVFSKTGTWLSRAINVFVRSKYVHVSISFDSNFTKMYSFGRTNPDDPFSGGFAVENLHEGVYKRFYDSRCLILKVKVGKEQYDSMKETVNCFLNEKERYRYNFLGLFAALFNKPFKRKYYYFCSQFVSELLIKHNVYSSNTIPELTRPCDLISIDNKEVYYEGFINEYYMFNKLYGFDYNFTSF